MGKFRCRIVMLFVVMAWLSPAVAWSADLTATEKRWLQGAWPVVAVARASGVPLDIVVQPQPTPGLAPLALAFIDGRCKLVLSMRGNPQAEETLARIEPELLDATLELMAAHEVGHCRRYLDGSWYTVPAGFAPSVPAEMGADAKAELLTWQAARREEGYGDLVGLAWIQRHRAKDYARLHAWLLAERLKDRIPGSPHDTLAWVRLAERGVGAVDASMFTAATSMWKAGLLNDD